MASIQIGPLGVPTGLPGGVSAALDVTAAQVIKATAGVCVRLSVVAGSGTLTVNDAATVGGATATNAIFNGSVTPGQVIELDWPCGSGITVSALPASGQIAVAFT